MIKILFNFDSACDELKLVVSGHGLLSSDNRIAFKGNDILCAAISSLVQGILIGLNFVVKADIKIIEKKSGYLECIVNNVSNNNIAILINTLFLSLKEIEKQYSDKILIQEVRK